MQNLFANSSSIRACVTLGSACRTCRRKSSTTFDGLAALDNDRQCCVAPCDRTGETDARAAVVAVDAPAMTARPARALMSLRRTTLRDSAPLTVTFTLSTVILLAATRAPIASGVDKHQPPPI